MASRRSTPTGLRARHSRQCKRETGGHPCRCKPGPSYEAWVYSKRDSRKIYRTFSGPGAFAAAKAWRADATAAVGRGRLRRTTRKTIREAAGELIAGMRGGSILSTRDRPYKPSTIRSYERALGLRPGERERAPERLLEAFGEVRLGDLDRHAVQDYANRLRAAGWGASTIQNQLDPLRVIYREARDRDEVAVDPLERLKLAKPKGRRERIASPAEAASLLEALPESDRAVWATAFYAGLRRGELRALRWHDVDLAAGWIHVRRGWDDEEGEQEDGKSDSAERDVPIEPVLRAELQAHRMRTGRRGRDLVFGLSGESPFTPSTVRRTALDAWAAAELKPITLHEGRHTFASLWIAAGVDAKAISKWMGHSTIQITFDRYGHLFDNAGEEAIRRVEAFRAAGGEAPRLRPV
jgi:integrase